MAGKIPAKSRARKPKPSKAKKPAKNTPVKLFCGACTFTYADGFVWRCEMHKQRVEERRADRIAKSALPFLLYPERERVEREARERELAISKVKTPRGWTRIGITYDGVLFGRGKGKRRKFQTVPLTGS